MNTVDKRQRFFTSHSDNVVSLALHKKYTRASGATGAWQPSRAAVRYVLPTMTMPIVMAAAAATALVHFPFPQLTHRAQGYTQEDVGCRTLAASGELGQHPKIYVWDTQTCQPLKELKGIHRCGAQRQRECSCVLTLMAGAASCSLTSPATASS
jgi:hypothetical protein